MTYTNDPRTVLLQLIASLTLCDHMGDVSNDITTALELIGEPMLAAYDEFEDLQQALAAEGITTLYGTSVV